MKVKKSQTNPNPCYNQNNKEKEMLSQRGESVQVYIRIRPFNEDELEKDKTTPIELIDTKNNAMICNL